MIVLALDLATLTGFAHGPTDTGELPTLGHKRLPSTGNDVGTYLCAFRDWLTLKVAGVGAGMVVFEAPILPGTTSLAATRKLQGLAGVTEMVCVDQGLTCREVMPATVKKALAGSGRADKAAMVRAARRYGVTTACPDEADAFGVWLATARQLHPQQAGRWDSLNFARTAA